MVGGKSLCFTYFLWFFFGWSGLHHFYLGRDRQAFVWWSTVGGFFYIGWIRDFWRIPEYVEDANEELEFMDSLTRKMKLRKEPPFNTSRFAGEMLIGYYYGLLVRFAIPEETPMSITGLLICLGINIGVYLVGNIGREKGPFLRPYFACLACYVVLIYLAGEEASYMYCALASSCAFNYYRQYKRKVEKKKLSTRLSHLSGGAVVVGLLWASFFCFNATITFQDGEKIRLRDSVNHFFKSPAWIDFKKTMSELYEEGQQQGWKNIYDEFIKALDPKGEANAYRVLGLDSSATEADIRRSYKKLVVKYHPDKYKEEGKEKAQARFIEIQQAYEILSRKKEKSSHSWSEEQRTEF